MRTNAKKITSLFLILFGLAPLIYVFVISIKKQEIRHRMKEKLEQQDLQTIILRENEVVWMDKHEIWVNNSMFDIHTKKLETGIYTFTGLYDDEETELVEWERNAAGKNNEQNKVLAQFLKSLPVFYTECKEIHIPTLQQEHYNSFITLNPVSPFREILTPPPQV